MKLSFQWLLLIFMTFASLAALLILAQTAAPASDNKPPDQASRITIAVMTFRNPTQHKGLVVGLENAVGDMIGRLNRFQLVDREQLPQILQELKLDESGVVDPQTATQLGQIKGVSYLVTGAVDSADGSVTESHDKKGNVSYSASVTVGVTYRVIQVQTGEVVLAHRYTETGSNSDNDIHDLLQKIVIESVPEFQKDLLDAMPLEGQVIQIKKEGGFFRINLGSAQGVSDQLDFEVFTFTQETLPGGQVVTDREKVCEARTIDIQDGMSKLEPGVYKREFFGPKWHKDLDLLDKITLTCVVRSKHRR